MNLTVKWRVINSGIARAAENMAVDEAMLHAHAAGDVPPTIRFYGWQPAAMSIGYFQKASAEVDVEKCRSEGIDVVRRLTGGRAVLHDEEFTYSVVVREDYPLLPATITASYRYLSEGLLTGLQSLGIDAHMNIPTAAYGQSKHHSSSAACFDAPSHYEITVQGRKLVGSAQVRKEGVVLQHGSILLTFNPAKVASLFNLPSTEKKQQLAQILGKRAVSIKEALGKEVAWEDLCQAMTAGFAQTLGAQVETGQLSDKEEAAANELAAAKYNCDSWNLMR